MYRWSTDIGVASHPKPALDAAERVVDRETADSVFLLGGSVMDTLLRAGS